jgi:hypothetical protein
MAVKVLEKSRPKTWVAIVVVERRSVAREKAREKGFTVFLFYYWTNSRPE